MKDLPYTLAPDPCGAMRSIMLTAPLSAVLWFCIIEAAHALL